MKRAIIYYSLTENTKAYAEELAKRLDADLFRINTVKPMPDSFSKQIMFGGMQSTFGLKPAIKNVPDNISLYDEIIIGTPVWAGKHSAPINTLIHKTNVKGKVVGAFIVGGGGENTKCIPLLKKLLPNLKYTAVLFDKKLNKEAENNTAIDEFVRNIN